VVPVNAVAQIFALLAALIHIVVFVWESILFHRPGVHRDIFKVRTEDVPAVRLWSFNVGFYNLFLGLGLIAGVVALQLGHEAVGRALLINGCAFVFCAGIVLAVSDRMELSRPRGSGIGGAVSQSLPALIALVAIAYS
jgi:putative membrane protein